MAAGREARRRHLPPRSRPEGGKLNSEPSPWTGLPRLRARGLLRDLHDGYRDYASPRCQRCSRVMLKRRVTIERSLEHGTCHFAGVARCGLVWECPDCSAAIKAERSKDLAGVFQWHRGRFGDAGIAMLTLTVAHDMGDDVAAVVRGVADAWRLFCQGKEWQRTRDRIGFVGSVRALEITFGPNGAHPHLHIALLTRLDVTKIDWFRRWAFERWAAAVKRALGAEHVPNFEHGATITRPADDGAYLCKLGLEISAPNTKRAKGENRTPLDLLAAFVVDGDVDALRTYRRYVRAMKGRRQLTWSRGLLVAAGVRDRTDQECAEEGENTEEIAALSVDEFRAVRRFPGACSTLLELAELHGAPAVYWFTAILVDADPENDKPWLVDTLRRRAENHEWLRR